MLFLSIGVCCPGFPLIVTRGKPLQLSGPWSDNAWFNSSQEPIRWENEPRDPNSCSQFLISQWREQRFALLRSSSRRNWRSSRKPVDLLSRFFFNIKLLLVARWMQFVQNWDHALKVPLMKTFKYSKGYKTGFLISNPCYKYYPPKFNSLHFRLGLLKLQLTIFI